MQVRRSSLSEIELPLEDSWVSWSIVHVVIILSADWNDTFAVPVPEFFRTSRALVVVTLLEIDVTVIAKTFLWALSWCRWTLLGVTINDCYRFLDGSAIFRKFWNFGNITLFGWSENFVAVDDSDVSTLFLLCFHCSKRRFANSICIQQQ
jgi:hypothetical protein